MRRSLQGYGDFPQSYTRRSGQEQETLAHQAKSGGFSWSVNGKADSNDTAAALEAFRVAGVHGKPVTRAVQFLRSFQNRDGGSFCLPQFASMVPSTSMR